MVKLEIEVTSTKVIPVIVNPIGNPQTSWLIRETFSCFYEQNTCHDGGWEEEAKWTYILSSKEALDSKFAEILAERKKNGWYSASGESPHYKKLCMRIGPTPLQLEYHFGEEQIVE